MNVEDNNGWSSLMIAADHGYSALCSELISLGAENRISEMMT